MGVQGVFTKELDSALLNNEADIAVHSLKDVPIATAKGLTIAAVLERSAAQDALIYKDKLPDSNSSFTVATSSIRRKAQWLSRYPIHKTENVRGNVETRIKKFLESDWDGLLMAKAAIERLNITDVPVIPLEWMLPAPAQGAIGVMCRHEDEELKMILQQLNNTQTFSEVMAERQFLHELKGGCSAPISALAEIRGGKMYFRGAVHNLTGTKIFTVTNTFEAVAWSYAGSLAAKEVMNSTTGSEILREIFALRPDFSA